MRCWKGCGSAPGPAWWACIRYAYGYDGAPGSVAVIGSPVFSLNLDGRQAGVLGAVAVAIDSRVIERNLQEFYLQEGLRYSLVAADRTAFLGQSLEISEADLSAAFETGHLAADSSGSSLLMTAIPAMDMVLVVQTDKLVLLKDLLTITLLVLGFVLCLLAGLLSMAGRISREITQPLALLTDAIKQMDADPTHMRHVPEAGNADFQMLSASLNRMLRRETRLTHELLEANRNLYESELTQKHLELQFLRSQINPHFLYNTLETIHSIAVVRRVPEAALAAKNLAKLLRYSIKGGEIMPLASELEIIQVLNPVDPAAALRRPHPRGVRRGGIGKRPVHSAHVPSAAGGKRGGARSGIVHRAGHAVRCLPKGRAQPVDHRPRHGRGHRPGGAGAHQPPAFEPV